MFKTLLLAMVPLQVFLLEIRFLKNSLVVGFPILFISIYLYICTLSIWCTKQIRDIAIKSSIGFVNKIKHMGMKRSDISPYVSRPTIPLTDIWKLDFSSLDAKLFHIKSINPKKLTSYSVCHAYDYMASMRYRILTRGIMQRKLFWDRIYIQLTQEVAWFLLPLQVIQRLLNIPGIM